MRNIILAVIMIAMAVALATAPALAGDRAVYKVATAEEKNYGEKKPVTTEKEARAALREYYKGKDIKVGEITEKELYFEADILDTKGEVSDKVIIDKRTGRIRSIY